MKSRIDGLAHLTMGEMIRTHAVNYPNDLAVVDLEYGKRFTYKELNDRVNRLSNYLLNVGVHKGDKIAIFMNDRSEWLEIVFAANKIGAVWVPINYRFTAEEAQWQIDHSESRILFFGADAVETIEKLKDDVPVEKYVSVGSVKQQGYDNYEEIMEGHPAKEPVPNEEVLSQEPICIIYTSGSTGRPKGVVHTHRSMIAWAFNAFYEFGPVREGRCLNPYPMFHLGGLIVSFTNFLGGGANYILGRFDPEKFLDTLEREKLTMFWAVPTIIHALSSLPQKVKDKYQLSSVTHFVTSSAPFYKETRERFHEQWPHIDMYCVYSATEMYFTCLRPRDLLRKKERCVGPASFGTEIKLIAEDGREVSKGEPGIVYGKGISRFLEYYKNPEAMEKAFQGEWFTCQDVGYLDEEGYLYLVDRAKDMIVSGGENVPSVEVENILLRHPAVYECAVIGVKDEKWGERVHAVISLKAGQEVTPDEIMEWCKGKMAGFKRPRSVSIVREIPKNPAGKIDKRNLREQFNP